MHSEQIPSGSSDGPATRALLGYFGADAKKFLIFGLVLLGAFAVGTVPYVLVVGYDKWAQNVGAATNMLLADFPVAASPFPQSPGSYSIIPTAAQGAPPASPSGCTRQYTCSQCGASGLPALSPAGQPTCALCGGRLLVSPGRKTPWPAPPPPTEL